MKIVQFLPTLAFGDAVGNDTVALQQVIRELGYETEIYAEAVDQRLPKGTASDLCQGMPALSPDDVILYHMSTGSALNYTLSQYPCRKILIYHNITPPHFFHAYNAQAETNAQYGLDGLHHLAQHGNVDYCLADSAFNAQELHRAGFRCPVDVRPVLIPFADYEKKPDADVIRNYGQDNRVNIVFVGRIAPNKRQERVIAAFACYQKYFNPEARLFLVGNAGGMERYQERLLRYVEALGVQNVIFPGHIPFSEILAYYHVADIFLCMSSHEGFCVPLVEAMYFDVPVIAYNSSAIAWTMGGSGIVTDTDRPAELACLIDRVLRDAKLRTQMLAGQRKRLEAFRYETVRNLFARQLTEFLQK